MASKTMRSKILIASLLLLCVNVPAFADDEEMETLRGLNGVYVVVENLAHGIKEHGLTEEQIQTDVELRLRTAGIKVLSREEHLKDPGMPSLYVRVGSVHRLGLFSLSVLVALKQGVSLTRNPTVRTHATTWETTEIGISGELYVQRIRDFIKDDVDEFINAYLAENPKK